MYEGRKKLTDGDIQVSFIGRLFPYKITQVSFLFTTLALKIPPLSSTLCRQKTEDPLTSIKFPPFVNVLPTRRT